MCGAASASPICAAKTWWVCRIEGAYCSLIGAPEVAGKHTLEYREFLAERYREAPERRLRDDKAKAAPWAVPFDDVIDLGAGENDTYAVIAAEVVSTDRLKQISIANRALLEGTTEVVVSHASIDLYANESIFVKRESGQWRVVAWHFAEVSTAGVGFGQDPNLTGVWAENCKPTFAACEKYVYGLTPYEKFFALRASAK